MAKTRSPEYPAVGLKEAVEKVKLVYEKDYQNRLPKKVIAEHMGYKGLNGGSLPVLAALNKYGLLEGRGDETRVSDLALAIIAHQLGSKERLDALKIAAANPDLFSELDAKFPGKASDAAIRSYLLTQKFIPEAADTAIRSYRETKALVEAESAGYDFFSDNEPDNIPMAPPQQAAAKQDGPAGASRAPMAQRTAELMASLTAENPPGTRREVFALDEGDVTLTFPENLSSASYEDLEAYLQLFLRKAKRRAEAEVRPSENESSS